MSSGQFEDWVTVVGAVTGNSTLADDRVRFSKGALGDVALPEAGTKLVLGVVAPGAGDVWELKVEAGSKSLGPVMEVSRQVLADLQRHDADRENACRIRRFGWRDRIAKAKTKRAELAVALAAVVTSVLALLTVAVGPVDATGPVRNLATDLEKLPFDPPALVAEPRPVTTYAGVPAGQRDAPPAVVRADEAQAAWVQAKQLRGELQYRNGVRRTTERAVSQAPDGTAATILKWCTALVAFMSGGFALVVAWKTQTAFGKR